MTVLYGLFPKQLKEKKIPTSWKVSMSEHDEVKHFWVCDALGFQQEIRDLKDGDAEVNTRMAQVLLESSAGSDACFLGQQNPPQFQQIPQLWLHYPPAALKGEGGEGGLAAADRVGQL